MTGDADWDLLSAYADDELPAPDRSALEARLAREPGLASELERILRAKDALAATRPAPAALARRPSSRPRMLALAASVLLAVGVSLAGYRGLQEGGEPRTAAGWHAELAANAYAAEGEGEGAIAPASAGALGVLGAPDLSASNLTLVDVRTGAADGGDSLAMHYRGPRGCRLTLVAEPPSRSDGAEEATGVALMHRWKTDRARFSLVADGMDGARFRAIADFAEALTRGTAPDEGLRLAMAEATGAAAPCA